MEVPDRPRVERAESRVRLPTPVRLGVLSPGFSTFPAILALAGWPVRGE